MSVFKFPSEECRECEKKAQMGGLCTLRSMHLSKKKP